ncbi:hypothetical protein TNCV_3609841 [Trichonephila clavipes]|nr:hypothetical protein TNCV_3609841 [Trichonephila clavipes]
MFRVVSSGTQWRNGEHLGLACKESSWKNCENRSIKLAGHTIVDEIACLLFAWTATAGSDVVQSGRPIFDDFFQHLWPYIGNNTANVAFQKVKRLWLIRKDQ